MDKNVEHTAISAPSSAAATAIALIAWAGLALQFHVSLARTGSAAATAWILLDYFTIITNFLVAVVFSGIALGKAQFAAPRLIAGIMLAILLVGIVYGLLLREELKGVARIGNLILHGLVPTLVPLFWLAFVPKGAVRKHDPLVWTAYPLIYFAYALARGLIEGQYPYWFINVDHIGWPQTLVNAFGLAMAFLLAGYATLGLDHRLRNRAEDR
jgi:hypothetical protein